MRIFWEHFGGRNNNHSYNKWDFYDTECTIQNSVRYSAESDYCVTFRYVAGSRLIQTTQFREPVTNTITSFSDGFIGFHARWDTVTDTSYFASLYNGFSFVTDLTLHFNGSGNMVVKVGGAVVATGTYTFLPNTWYHIEIRPVIHSSAGIIQTWVNGDADINASGLNTRVSATTISGIRFINQSAGNQWYMDNLMINDTTDTDGLGNTGRIGPREMFVQFPTGDGTNGIDNEWTPSTGSTRFGVVDEANVNADVDYFNTLVTAKRQRLTFPTTGLEETFHVYSVGFEHVARGVSGLESAKLGVKEGGVSTLGVSQSLLTNYKTKVIRFQTLPSTAALNVSSALQCDALIESDF